MHRPGSIVLAGIAAILLPSSGALAQSGVDWVNPVKVTVASSALSKSSGCNDCPDAGAISAQQLTGDGFIEFVPIAGHRFVTGLGGDLTAGTGWAIDHAFSFWPGGTWEIREAGVYRTEGRITQGDRFRVAVQGGTVIYQQNGVTVYQTAAQSAFPLVMDTSFFTIGGGITESVMGPLDVVAPVQDAPSEPTPEPEPAPGTIDTSGYFSAITDRIARPLPPLPSAGTAGSVFTDPTFHSSIMRITDGATRPGRLDRSYRTPSSAHQHSWSAAASYFYVVSTDGTIVPFTFDAITGTAARIDPTATGDGGLVLRSFGEPQFSYVTDHHIYGTYSGSGATLRTIDQYDFSTRAWTRLVDLDLLAPNLAGTYVGWVGSSAGAVERIATFFGGTSQDRHFYALVFDRNDPSRRRLVDTKASTLDGKPTNIPLNFSLHAMGIDRSGRFAMLYTTWADMAEPRKAAPSYLWDIETGTFTALPLVEGRNGGHDAYGYGVRVNQYCCTSTPYDAAQWQFRALDAPFATRDVIPAVVTPKRVYMADHSTWHNARPDVHVPFISALYRSAPEAVEWRPWDEEIIGVQSDADPGTPGTVWRFAHHRSDVMSDADPTRSTFWYMPRPSVSSDGRWVLFTSNWGKSLGIDPGGDAAAGHRQDVFLVRLEAQAPADPVAEPAPEPTPEPEPDPVVTSISIATASLPDGVRRKAYAAALAAADAEGAITWAVSSGSLPPGLSLGASGIIAGTCEKPGNWTFTISATDSRATATRELMIHVRAK